MLVLVLLLQADDLVYVRRGSREETRRASIEATERKLPPVKQGPWWKLPAVTSQGRGERRAPVDPAVEVDLGRGKRARWQDGSALEDGREHDLPGPSTLGRTLAVEDELAVTVTIGSEKTWGAFLNGDHVWTPTHMSTHVLPDKVYRFGVTLKRGVNHLLFEISGAGKFFYSLSPLGGDLLAALEKRLDADFPDLSEQAYYRLEPVPVPKEISLEVGGMKFLPDGALALCTRRGEVWFVERGQWRRFASGLNEPLGLWAERKDEVFVVQRNEITRVADTDGDGAADLYATFCDGWEGATGGEYAFGLLRDREGSFWAATAAGRDAPPAKYLGWCFKVTPRGEFVPWASGLRTPNGLAFDGSGELFIADNQGNWVGTSTVYHIVKDGFYGHPSSLSWHPDFAGRKPSIAELERRRKRAAVLLPHGILGQSPSQPIFDETGGRFGPFAGQMFVGDQTSSIVTRVSLERVEGELQGACFPFRRGFQSGNNRLDFAADGSLWVGQTDRGWGAVGGRPFGLERVVWTGRVPMEIRTMSLAREGFDLEFTKPVDPATARDPAAYSLQHYYYLYHETYGSPQVGHTPAPVKEVRLSGDRRRVLLVLAELVPGRLYELHVRGLRAADGTPLLHPEAWYTLNVLRR